MIESNERMMSSGDLVPSTDRKCEERIKSVNEGVLLALTSRLDLVQLQKDNRFEIYIF